MDVLSKIAHLLKRVTRPTLPEIQRRRTLFEGTLAEILQDEPLSDLRKKRRLPT